MIFAHRGMFNNIDIPENSILAFKQALKNKYAIELDIELTKDNIPVVFHDKNLYRMTKVNKDINDLTYEELSKLKLLKTSQTIPTLKEVLKLVDGKVLLNIEIKPTRHYKKVCNLVLNELVDYNHDYLFQSFSPRIIRYLHNKNKSLNTGLLMSKKFYNTPIGFALVKYSKPNFLSVSKRYINNYKSKYKNYKYMIWTIKNKEEMNKYKNITDNYICNNLPY